MQKPLGKQYYRFNVFSAPESNKNNITKIPVNNLYRVLEPHNFAKNPSGAKEHPLHVLANKNNSLGPQANWDRSQDRQFKNNNQLSPKTSKHATTQPLKKMQQVLGFYCMGIKVKITIPLTKNTIYYIRV